MAKSNKPWAVSTANTFLGIFQQAWDKRMLKCLPSYNYGGFPSNIFLYRRKYSFNCHFSRKTLFIAPAGGLQSKGDPLTFT